MRKLFGVAGFALILGMQGCCGMCNRWCPQHATPVAVAAAPPAYAYPAPACPCQPQCQPVQSYGPANCCPTPSYAPVPNAGFQRSP